MAKVKIIRACVADLETRAVGEVVELSANAAALLIASGQATEDISAAPEPAKKVAKKKVAAQKED